MFSISDLIYCVQKTLEQRTKNAIGTGSELKDITHNALSGFNDSVFEYAPRSWRIFFLHVLDTLIAR